MAVVCAAAYARKSCSGMAGLFWAWAAAVAASTLLTRQHYVADVVVGALLGYVVADRTLAAAGRTGIRETSVG